MELEISLLLRLLTAIACGALIGFERSKRQKEAGIRTHIMVTLGAALVVIVSKYGFLDVAGSPGINVDVSRMAANIITGVSFLGAGVIFLRGGYVRGLTTAAGIWSTAGVGCAIGSGMYIVGVSSTFMIIVIQTILHVFIPGSENMSVAEISAKMIYDSGATERLKADMKAIDITVIQMNISKNTDDTMIVDMIVRFKRDISSETIIDLLNGDCNVIEFSMQF